MPPASLVIDSLKHWVTFNLILFNFILIFEKQRHLLNLIPGKLDMCSLTSFIREPTFNKAQVVWYSMKVSLENSGWFSALSPTKKPILLLLKKNKMLITSGQVFGKTPGYAKNRNCFLCSEKMVIYRNVIFYLCFALDSPWPLIFPICYVLIQQRENR